MGRTIHAYVEYRESLRDDSYTFYAEVALQRNDVLFGVMGAGQHPFVPNFSPKFKHLWPSRGLPDMLSNWVHRKYTIADSRYDGPNMAPRIPNPNYHSISWMIAAELEQAYHEYQCVTSQPDSLWDCERLIDIEGTIAILKALPHSRLVFWFDN